MLTIGYVAERVGETDIGLAKLDDGTVLEGKAKDIPGEGDYLQGIWATNSPEIRGTIKIRAGVCGSAVVRYKAKEATKSLDGCIGQICR